MKVLILDNYDSFTYNLVHYVRELTDSPISIARNDQITLEEVNEFDHILLSPGPGIPDEAGLLKAIIKEYASTKSIFGVCLGMQAIGEVFGCKLLNLDHVYHGVDLPIRVTDPKDITFTRLPSSMNVGRYHSWVVDQDSVPDCLSVSALDDNNYVMALYHKELNIRGVQFHPESIMTEHGKIMLKNWLSPTVL